MVSLGELFNMELNKKEEPFLIKKYDILSYK